MEKLGKFFFWVKNKINFVWKWCVKFMRKHFLVFIRLIFILLVSVSLFLYVKNYYTFSNLEIKFKIQDVKTDTIKTVENKEILPGNKKGVCERELEIFNKINAPDILSYILPILSYDIYVENDISPLDIEKNKGCTTEAILATSTGKVNIHSDSEEKYLILSKIKHFNFEKNIEEEICNSNSSIKFIITGECNYIICNEDNSLYLEFYNDHNKLILTSELTFRSKIILFFICFFFSSWFYIWFNKLFKIIFCGEPSFSCKIVK